MHLARSKWYFIVLWLTFLVGGLSLYFFYPDFFRGQLERATGVSLYLGYLVLLVVGSLRGFTLIPSTYLIIAGLFFFAPVPLFVLIMAGILISSISVYYFSEYLNLDELFEAKHGTQIERIKRLLEKNELLIITLWSFAPILPTDLICYVCGSLSVDVKKFVLGVFIGESITVGIYIFVGGYLLQNGHSIVSFFL